MAFSALFFSCGKENKCGALYEGTHCNTEVKKKYLGTYVGTTTEGVPHTTTYDISSIPGDAEYLRVGNMDAKMKTSTTFEIRHEAGTVLVTGNGSFDQKKVYFTFKNNMTNYPVSFNGTKQ